MDVIRHIIHLTLVPGGNLKARAESMRSILGARSVEVLPNTPALIVTLDGSDDDGRLLQRALAQDGVKDGDYGFVPVLCTTQFAYPDDQFAPGCFGLFFHQIIDAWEIMQPRMRSLLGGVNPLGDGLWRGHPGVRLAQIDIGLTAQPGDLDLDPINTFDGETNTAGTLTVPAPTGGWGSDYTGSNQLRINAVGHGGATGPTMFSRANNGVGNVGIAPDTTHIVCSMSVPGSVPDADYSTHWTTNIARSIDAIIGLNAHIVNISLGNSLTSVSPIGSTFADLGRSVVQGIGNSRLNLVPLNQYVPGTNYWAIKHAGVWYVSGDEAYSNYGAEITDIVALCRGMRTLSGSQSSGTSCSAPVVAAVEALVWSLNPPVFTPGTSIITNGGWARSVVEGLLKNNVNLDPRDSRYPSPLGYVNAFRAVKAGLSLLGLSPPSRVYYRIGTPFNTFLDYTAAPTTPHTAAEVAVNDVSRPYESIWAESDSGVGHIELRAGDTLIYSGPPTRGVTLPAMIFPVGARAWVKAWATGANPATDAPVLDEVFTDTRVVGQSSSSGLLVLTATQIAPGTFTVSGLADAWESVIALSVAAPAYFAGLGPGKTITIDSAYFWDGGPPHDPHWTITVYGVPAEGVLFAGGGLYGIIGVAGAPQGLQLLGNSKKGSTYRLSGIKAAGNAVTVSTGT